MDTQVAVDAGEHQAGRKGNYQKIEHAAHLGTSLSARLNRVTMLSIMAM